MKSEKDIVGAVRVEINESDPGISAMLETCSEKIAADSNIDKDESELDEAD